MANPLMIAVGIGVALFGMGMPAPRTEKEINGERLTGNPEGSKDTPEVASKSRAKPAKKGEGGKKGGEKESGDE